MAGRLFLVKLPEWKEDEKEESHSEIPCDSDKKNRKWNVSRFFRKRKGHEQEKAEDLVSYPHVRSGMGDGVRLVVKAKILEDTRQYAWAGIIIPTSTTYREFTGFALKELRRQSLQPSRIPTRMLVRGVVVDWHLRKTPRRSLPQNLDEDNFQGSLLAYDRSADIERPAELEIKHVVSSSPSRVVLNHSSGRFPVPTRADRRREDSSRDLIKKEFSANYFIPQFPNIPHSPPVTRYMPPLHAMKDLKLELKKQEKSRDELTEGLDIYNGIAIPPHMSLPGQDGYRTPNVHDYERHKMEAVEDMEEQQPTNGAKTPPPSAGIFNIHSVADLARLSKIDLTLERLHWRERIRHYTWTFFTLTMATGGIANVLYTGEPLVI
ncbi:MAG: hypothetical protein Q9225_000061 [Loekoesia sp. 1 TL-2023]